MWTMQILVTNNKMKFAKENLNLEKGLNKEWVITNGLGGFASSTIIGANTRRYHGLLEHRIIQMDDLAFLSQQYGSLS